MTLARPLRPALLALLAAVLALPLAAAPARAGHDTVVQEDPWAEEGWEDQGSWDDDQGWDEEDWEDGEEDWGDAPSLPPAATVPAEEAAEAFDLPAAPVSELPGAPSLPATSPAPSAPRSGTTTGGGKTPNVPYGKLIASTARRHGLPVSLFTALVWQESGFKARARSRVGARGLTQLMPATARGLGVKNAYDPKQNLNGGAKYLKAQLRRFRSTRLALAAYNAGPGAVARYRGVPPYAETRNYVKRILARQAQLKRAGIR